MADNTAPTVNTRTAPVTVPVRTPDALNQMSWGAIPVMTNAATFAEIGNSGLKAFAGYVREEFLPQLVGRQAARVYREMQDNSPVVGGILFAIKAAMRKVEWRSVPPNDSGAAQEMADFADSLRNDMSITWEDHVDETLSMLTYGYAPHEINYKRRMGRTPGADPQSPGRNLPKSEYDDGKIGWRSMPVRGQDTVLKWFFDQNGEIKGMTQQPWTGPVVDIPIEKMLLFRTNTYKNNPESRSLLRSAYRSYWFIKRMEEQEAIMLERMNGVPVIRVPAQLLADASAGISEAVAALNAYKAIVVNIRVDEQMGLLLPSSVYEGANGPSNIPQYSFELVTPKQGRATVNANETITRHQTNMMTSMLADFIQLGHSARGTQGTSTNKIDMFYGAIEGFLNANAAIYNRHALPRVWDLNGLDFDLKPTFEPDMATRLDLDVLSNFILRLSQSGMPLFPNDELQSYLLDAAGIPDVTDPMALEAAGLTPELIEQQSELALNPPPPPPIPGQPPKPGDNPNDPRATLEKIIRLSIARRMHRMAGPRFGITTKRHKHGAS
jgi:hypothetical protein